MRTAILAMAVVVLAIGFCVFDGGDHDGMDDHASGEVDLCLGMLAVSPPVALTAGLPLMGCTSAYGLAPVREFSPHVPAPPPKRPS